jgi:hypothetical protein
VCLDPSRFGFEFPPPLPQTDAVVGAEAGDRAAGP